MMKRIVFLTCAAWATTGAMHNAQACAGLDLPGATTVVNDEAAAIVWDAKTGTEHFIRRATFNSASPKAAQNIGFLVPTPTMPQIGAVDAAIFDRLEAATKPRVETTTLTGFKVGSLFLRGGAESEKAPAAVAKSAGGTTSVQVSKTVRVGDYDATVLSARDTKSLAKWLRAHKFNADASLQGWLAPYVKRGWKITAFKVVNKNGGAQFGLSPVRLSFKTDAPFYPYREPARARAKGNFASSRALKVYFVGDARVGGTIGSKKKWAGATEWTAALPAASLAGLTGSGVPRAALTGARMTIFRDASSPRPGTDEVFFKPSPLQSKIFPEPILRTVDKRATIPLELLLLGLIGGSVAAMKGANAFADKRHARLQQKIDSDNSVAR